MNALKRARAESGLSLRGLADISGVDQSTISRLENGSQKAHLSTLAKLARALGCSLEQFSGMVDSSAPARGRLGAEARYSSIKKEEKKG